ncbi:MAG: sulfur carrier protein ThiS [Deltaproteobacteria bacterium]|nr:sulfur carrier protein ThiS [Deltaproteobacteria bacterium]
MRVTVNGQQKEEANGTTVADLAASLKLDARNIAVELNRAIVKKSEYGSTVLHDGDTVEIVTFVGGG